MINLNSFKHFSKAKLIVPIIFIFSCTAGIFAQKTKTYYIGESGQLISKKDALYKREVTRYESRWLVCDYYLNDSLCMKGYYLDRNLKIETDTFRTYHINGKPSEIIIYKDGLINGEYQKYNIAGTKIMTGNYTDGKSDNYWKRYNNPVSNPKYANAPSYETYKLQSMPEYPGGHDAYMAHLKSYHYPHQTSQEGYYGKVIATFVVSETGEITDIDIILHGNAEMDSLAVKMIQEMPDWKPATINGKAVSSFFILPITFLIGDEKVNIKNRKIAEAYFVSGVNDYKNNKFPNATFKFKNAIYYDNANAKYYYYLAVSLYQYYDPDIACEYFKIANMLDDQIVKPDIKKFCNF